MIVASKKKLSAAYFVDLEIGSERVRNGSVLRNTRGSKTRGAQQHIVFIVGCRIGSILGLLFVAM
jgi:hypothetical protein